MANSKSIHDLARLYRIQSAYWDGLGQLRQAPSEAIVRVLQALGAPMASAHDIYDAYRQRRQTLWQCVIEPAIVAWQGDPLRVKLRLPAELSTAPAKYRIDLETGGRLEGDLLNDPAAKPVTRTVEGAGYLARRLIGQLQLPLGYHKLAVQIGALQVKSVILSAPLQAYAPTAPVAKGWGLFCPLYALHSADSWGAGNFSDLGQLIEYSAALGSHATAVLPMLASFLDEPFDSSPYAPVSRLFWNEFYLDVTKVPELAHCASAARLLNSDSFREELSALRGLTLVDYRRVMALKRRVLEALLGTLDGQGSFRQRSFDRYAVNHPAARDYAAFRARVEREQTTWPHWEAGQRSGKLTSPGDNLRAERYHLYAQWLCEEQIARLREQAQANNGSLYLDFPLGVNRDGFDVWRHPELFALDINGGAPPDGLFIKGQNWGFPPLHPDNIRRQGYGYFIDCLRHHLSSSGILRIDHVMGLHRAFWVPEGFGASDGVYVHYRAAEFHAIVNLESHRYQSRIVGENLGTVPPYVNSALSRHGVLGTHVGQFGVNADPAQALEQISTNVVASLNTHDTATFMGFWLGKDIDDRVALGLLDETLAGNERDYRAAQREALTTFLRGRGLLSEDRGPAAVLRGWLAYLAAQNEEFLLINLEDLWLEAAPQNVPGTWMERPNWRRKAAYSIEQIRQNGSLRELLKTLSDIRARIV